MKPVPIFISASILMLIYFPVSCQAQNKKPGKQEIAKTTSNTSCGCDYFPLCKYDGTRTFKDGVWKAVDIGKNDNEEYVYYKCENGILKRKQELISNWNGESWGYETVIELKYNEPTGTSWTQETDMKGNKFYYEHSIIEKDQTFTFPDGKVFNNVMKVYRKKSGASFFYEGEAISKILISSEYVYYAKGVGEVYRENASDSKAIKSAKTESESAKTGADETDILTKNLWLDKGILNDAPSKGKTWKICYQFYKDGTFEVKTNFVIRNGQVIVENKLRVDETGSWRKTFDGSDAYIEFKTKKYDFWGKVFRIIGKTEQLLKLATTPGGKTFIILPEPLN